MKKVDFLIIGGGIFGCFAAYYYASRYPESKLMLIEKEKDLMIRASYINQARVHLGYHYPRSIATALSSAKYYDIFCKEFNFAINSDFKKIYGISNYMSYTEPEMFELFCNNSNIPFTKINPEGIFRDTECKSAYEVKESSFDIKIIREYFIKVFKNFKNLEILSNQSVEEIKETDSEFNIKLSNNNLIISKYVLNSTYASINKIQELFGESPFKLKYELCEIILCNANKNLKNMGITMMDGPFFSTMPFGNSGLHSLSSVEYTPHKISESTIPFFDCQKLSSNCQSNNLDNCNTCPYRPKTNFLKMYKLAKKYLDDKYDLEYVKSLFTIKTVPVDAENSDSRPTIIKSSKKNSNFYTVLSGKINTVFDLIELIDNVKQR